MTVSPPLFAVLHALGAVPRLEPVREWIPIEPTPRQAVFLALEQIYPHRRQALYGGAAGGGKSIALLAAAAQYVDQPDYAALILRRTFSDLAQPGALIEVSRRWWHASKARWDAALHRWRFPSGAIVQFGFIEHPGDEERYRGAEYQFIGFDELSQFDERYYRFLFSRLRRRVSSAVPLRMRGASNPGGIGHEWVRSRFVDRETRDPDCTFVPASIENNPHLDRESYLQSLAHLDPVTRAQLEAGDWSARACGMLRREWLQVVEDRWPIEREVRAWDLARSEPNESLSRAWASAWTVGVRMARLRQPAPVRWFIRHVVRGQWSPGKRDQVIASTASIDGRGVRILIEQEPGKAGLDQVDTLRRMLVGYATEAVLASGPKEVRFGPFASAAELGMIGIVAAPWTAAYLDAVEAFPAAGRDEGDATAHAFAGLSLPAGSGAPRVDLHRPPGVLDGLAGSRAPRIDDDED